MTTLVHRPNGFAVSPNLSRDIDRMLGEVFGTASKSIFVPFTAQESDDAYIIAADVPGIDAEQINLTFRDQMLVVEGERTAPERIEGSRELLCEQSYGSFRREFRFRTHVDAEAIDASFSNGVLTVTIPKVEAAKARQIEIKSR